jgi:hypothetical protein
MKLTCSEYVGFKDVLTALGAPTEVFYQGDASSTMTIFIVAYYSAAPYTVVVFENQAGVLISTVTADYASAISVSGLQAVEI